MGDHFHLRLLGPIQVEREGQPVHGLESGKALGLLGYLAVHGQPVSREYLADLFWRHKPEDRGRANLSWTLHKISSRLPGCLKTDRETVQFQQADPSTSSGQAPYWLDIVAFEELVAQGEATALAEAVELYRGDFLEGLYLDGCADFEIWLVGERERWRQRVAQALGELVTHHGRRGEHKQGLRYTRRLLALEPWREETHRQVMRLLARDGQRSAALAQYETCRRVLAEELGVEPAVETMALYERIRNGASPFPPHNLPAPLTIFIGREAELSAIKDRLRDPNCRLLTLVGPGGSGKTRLTLEAAAAQLDNFEHGVVFVSLAPLQSVGSIVPTVGQALGFSFHGERDPQQQQLLDYLRRKGMLLIMDSFEHLLEGTGLVTEILRAAPGVKILATSRARLNVGGEHRFRIAGMDYPDEETTRAGWETFAQRRENVAKYGAVKLFLQGARRAQPGFELTAENLSGVVRVCHLVDGLPLGIRLAAAWVEMLTPAEIAAEIGRSLDFLATGRRDAPTRQRSLRAAFDHSYHLLSEREREVFQRLSVFRGGFTRDAAQEVTGGSLRELRALVDKSLLERDPAPSTPLRTGGRYDVHELLRQYGEERLEEVPAEKVAARDRHCAYYTAALQAWAGDLKGPRQQTALAGIEADSENARAAWTQAAEQGDVERLEQAMEGLCLFYKWRGRYQDGEAACRAAADKLLATTSGGGSVPSPSTTLRTSGDGTSVAEGLRVLAKALAWQSSFDLGSGRIELARQLVRQSLGILGGPELADQDTQAERAIALRRLGEVMLDSDFEEARRLFEQSLTLYRSLDDRWGMACALQRLGQTAWSLRQHAAAKRLYEESLAIRRALGDRRGIAHSLMALADIAARQGRLEEAERVQREGLAFLQEIGDKAEVTWGLMNFGGTLAYLGRFAEACAPFEESAAISDNLGMRTALAWATELLGWIKTNLGLYEEAHDLQQAGLDMFSEIGSRPGIGESLLGLGNLALVREAYAEARDLLERSATIFQEVGERDELNLVLTYLGHAAFGLGQLAQARRYLIEALQGAAEAGTLAPAVFSIALVALLLANQGEAERAVELYALASRHPYVGNSRYQEDTVGRHIAAAAATLPPEVAAGAQARGRARDLEATVAELLVELGGK
jgi:predicted ATPase/DNA-binding SARP family transcriptional activator